MNLGLIAQLENEAQLAFILCHELQHFIHQHPINRYVESDKLKASTRLVNMRALEKYLLAKNQYSRELETEADQEGFLLYETSNYSMKAVDGVFDVLQYSYLPFDEVEWDNKMFETEHLKFPADFTLDSLNPITVPEEDPEGSDDARGTHPNIAKRRAMMEELTARHLKDKERQRFIFGEDNFKQIRKICRFELSHEFLFMRRYEAAMYNSFLLLQEHPNSFYLKKTIAQSLYGLARYKNERNFYDVHVDYEEIEGQSQQLYYFIEQFDKPQLMVFATQYAYRLHQQYPDDIELQAIVDELLSELFDDHRETAEAMSNEPRKVGAPPKKMKSEEDPEGSAEDDLKGSEGDFRMEVGSEKETETEEEGSKYDKIRKEKAEKAEEEDEDFHFYAFVDLFDDADFVEQYSDLMSTEEAYEEAVYESPRERKRRIKRERLQGEALGLDKVVFVTPIYKKLDERKKVQRQFVASEQGLTEFGEMIGETADRVGLKYDLLASHAMKTSDMARFNDMVVLTNWMSDFFEGENDMRLVNVFKEEATELAKKYDTQYFAWTGVVLLTQRHRIRSTLLLCAGCIFYPLWPVIIPTVIYRLIFPKHGMLYVNLVFDVEANDIAMQEMRYIGLKDRKSVIKGALYNSMLQMKSRQK
ncbi:MAG: M48 family metalloprotease [Bacteroidota bacterium]